MSNSSLINNTILAHSNNYYGKRTAKIDTIVLHHMGGILSASQCANLFTNPNRYASSNYTIGVDGDICLCVDESNASGCSSNKTIDNRSITIEISNSSVGGDWPISDKSLKSLINLCTDICKRNNFIYLEKGKNLVWHSMFANTLCPGKYILSKIEYIVSSVNQNLKSNKWILNGFDIQRKKDYLVFYTKGNSTKTNNYGCEIVVKNNTALNSGVYGVGNSKIDSGCWVLSGHGISCEWMKQIKKGDKIYRSGDIVRFERMTK